jgi:hypothetical protein
VYALVGRDALAEPLEQLIQLRPPPGFRYAFHWLIPPPRRPLPIVIVYGDFWRGTLVHSNKRWDESVPNGLRRPVT